MDIKRNVLILALAVVSYLLLLAWNDDNPAVPTAVSSAENNSTDMSTTIPSANSDDLPAVQNTSNTTEADNNIQPSGDLITVTTPVQVVTIDLLGGDIVSLKLPKFPVALNMPDVPFALLSNSNDLLYIAQSGLIGRSGPDASGSRPQYSTSRSEYSLENGELSVDLMYQTAAGVEITKRFTFSASDYLINVEYLVSNNGTSDFSANMFGLIKRNNAPDPSDSAVFGMQAYLGAVMNTADDPYEKLDFDDIDDGAQSHTMTGGWIGFSQHYFLGSWIPDADSQNTFSTRKNSNGDYLLDFVGSEFSVPAGQSTSVNASFWAGPKDQYRLKEISPDLGLTIDYGKVWFVAYPIFWLLTQIKEYVGNVGLSIILLTLFIRVVFYPLSAKQFRSQANMKRIQPKIALLKEKYGEDKQKFMQAQMDLWKKENVNPFSGCLPPLLQMPVFIGFYWVLRESVEVRQAPFMLWYNDLSVSDPFYVLPLLLGVVFFLQQQMTPMMTADPTQAKVMKFMPVMFTVFFLWFPTGLVLYSLVNALTGVIQQSIFNFLANRKIKKAES